MNREKGTRSRTVCNCAGMKVIEHFIAPLSNLLVAMYEVSFPVPWSNHIPINPPSWSETGVGLSIIHPSPSYSCVCFCCPTTMCRETALPVCNHPVGPLIGRLIGWLGGLGVFCLVSSRLSEILGRRPGFSWPVFRVRASPDGWGLDFAVVMMQCER